jgi:hypothetical protein
VTERGDAGIQHIKDLIDGLVAHSAIESQPLVPYWPKKDG